ncbi:hypothetical protein [Streptomyces sp. NPDC058401]|uniref:hypothetical protein n=1 Tax=Streptomyces sp. NPDC058401 TaxID=3346480 RepID=UPI003657A9EB
MFALSFALTAGFWRDHRRIIAGLRNSTVAVTRVILLGLGLVALLPFPTALLAGYASQPDAVAGRPGWFSRAVGGIRNSSCLGGSWSSDIASTHAGRACRRSTVVGHSGCLHGCIQ